MKPFRWNEEKNRQLQSERGVSFEQVRQAIAADNLLDVIEHPNQAQYLSQRIFIIELNQYVYLVPFVESDQEIFLKTIIPSTARRKFAHPLTLTLNPSPKIGRGTSSHLPPLLPVLGEGAGG